MTDYEFNYQRATTNQGLDPVVEALTAAGIENFVEQTGGYTMVVVVPYGAGNIGIIVDAGAYLVADYPGKTWDEGDGSEASVNDEKPFTTEALVALIRRDYLDHGPAWFMA